MQPLPPDNVQEAILKTVPSIVSTLCLHARIKWDLRPEHVIILLQNIICSVFILICPRGSEAGLMRQLSANVLHQLSYMREGEDKE